MLRVLLHLGQGFLCLWSPLSLLLGWRELKASLLPAEAPTWGLLLGTSSHEAIPVCSGQELHLGPSARMSKGRLSFQARCRLHCTSSSLEMALCASAGRILAPSTLLSTWMTWLMVVIRLLFWVHQTPEEALRSKASWLVCPSDLASEFEVLLTDFDGCNKANKLLTLMTTGFVLLHYR